MDPSKRTKSSKRTKATAAYIRVSTEHQNESLQRDAIQTWANAHGVQPAVYVDHFSGRTMDRPGWRNLEGALRAGRITRLVVWKLDRLGRTTSGLAHLFDELKERGVALESLTEGFDLAKPMGRLVADILASVAAYETEVRGERVRAGMRAARRRGKVFGGSEKGWTILSDEQVRAVRRLHAAGEPISTIARTLGINWRTARKALP
jgi:DNA invertase Pin-like site-specific DNA recombinase